LPGRSHVFSVFHLLSFSNPHLPLVSSSVYTFRSLRLRKQSFLLLVLSTLRWIQINMCLPPPHVWTICATCGQLNERPWKSALWCPYYFDTWHSTSWIRAQLDTRSECCNIANEVCWAKSGVWRDVVSANVEINLCLYLID
jgi:hypothetical protein